MATGTVNPSTPRKVQLRLWKLYQGVNGVLIAWIALTAIAAFPVQTAEIAAGAYYAIIAGIHGN